MLNEIYYDEKNHVTTLLGLLGSSAISRPAINLGAYATITATNALSICRQGCWKMWEFPPSQAPLAPLTSSNLTFASQILGVESFPACRGYPPGQYPEPNHRCLRQGGFVSGCCTHRPWLCSSFVSWVPLPAVASSQPPAPPPVAPQIPRALPSPVHQFPRFSRSLTAPMAVVAASGTSSGGFFPNGVKRHDQDRLNPAKRPEPKLDTDVAFNHDAICSHISQVN